jgi:transcriptional regulator with XRE-family HTH domain
LEQKGRIRELRKSLNLRQAEFAKKIGLSDSAMSRIETGENALTEQNIFLICSSYGVNEEWLRHGKGLMFDNNAIPGAKDLMDTYKELLDINRKLVLDHAHYLLDSQNPVQKGEKPEKEKAATA